MNHPIVRRELVGVLRGTKALWLQWAAAGVFGLLVLLRWPADAQVGISGALARHVFSLFAYGVMGVALVVVPAFAAVSIVREKNAGTLALLIHSPLRPWSIYLGKLAGILGFALVLLAMSLPAAAACYAMGGLSLGSEVLRVYGLVAVAILQASTLGLFVSARASTSESALRITYGGLLLIVAISMGPHLFLQGRPGAWAQAAEWLRCVSPAAALMEVLGHGDVAAHGVFISSGVAGRYLGIGLGMAGALALGAVVRLNTTLFDRPRPPGVMTEDRSAAQQWVRRILFLVDPQRRKPLVGRFCNPVLVKEFRSRRFGRSHWMVRLAAGCAVLSLALTYAATLGTLDWGPETVGGLMVLLQGALIGVVTPALAATLISMERESGGWTLLQMTPLSAGSILRGKLLSVLWPVTLLLVATLPGYVVMIAVEPLLWPQVWRVLSTLLLSAVFALLASAAVGSFFRRTAVATTAAYALLIALWAGSMLVWLGRDAPFGHEAVEAVLRLNPLAAALNLLGARGFTHYHLLPANWWYLAGGSALALAVLVLQTRRLVRPQ